MLKRLGELKKIKEAEFAEKKRVEKELLEKAAAEEAAKNVKTKTKNDSIYSAKAGFAVINSGNAIMRAMGLKIQQAVKEGEEVKEEKKPPLPRKNIANSSKLEQLEHHFGVKSFKIIQESLREGIINVNSVLNVFKEVVHDQDKLIMTQKKYTLNPSLSTPKSSTSILNLSTFNAGEAFMSPKNSTTNFFEQVKTPKTVNFNMRPQTSIPQRGKSRNIQTFTFSQTEKSGDQYSNTKSRLSINSRISDVSTEEEKTLLHKIKLHSNKVPHADNKIREAIALIQVALQKQEWLQMKLNAGPLGKHAEAKAKMEKELAEISDKMRDCMRELRKSEQQVYLTKKDLQQMLDQCLPQEEINEYDKKVFNPVQMNYFIQKASLLIPDIMQIRGSLQPFQFGPRPVTSNLEEQDQKRIAQLIDQKYYIYFGETETGVDPVGRTTFTPKGRGLIVYKKEQTFFEGWFSSGGHITGRCRNIRTDTIYEGEFLNDEIHGKGHQRWLESNCEYVGDYIKGMRDGYGKYRYKNGDTYEGEWMDNNINGHGKYTWVWDNKSTEGPWKNGKKDGVHNFRRLFDKEKHFWKDGKLIKKAIIMKTH